MQYLINNQDGTFNDASSLLPDKQGDFPKLADFNNDGWMDLITIYTYPILHLNAGQGHFVNATHLLPSVCKCDWCDLNVGDFDNDGDTDIFLVTGDGEYHVINNLRPFDVGATPLNAPTSPTLISPINGETVSKSPTLLWNENGPTTSNHVQIATDVNFSSIVFDKSGITTSHHSPDLLDIQTYYWRVRGTNTGGTGQWSDAESFITEN